MFGLSAAKLTMIWWIAGVQAEFLLFGLRETYVVREPQARDYSTRAKSGDD
jgi:hypothetical protein